MSSLPQLDERPAMPTLHGPLLFVNPGAYQEPKSFPKSTTSPFNNLLGCNTVCSSVEGHHVQKPHIVSSFRVNFTRVSHYLQRSLNERTTRHWLVRYASPLTSHLLNSQSPPFLYASHCVARSIGFMLMLHRTRTSARHAI